MDLNKVEIHQKFLQIITDKIDVFQDMIKDLTIDSQNDAKSSAGDKHETALSMLHLEQEKITAKLQECLTNKQIFSQINPENSHKIIGVGSLVKTNFLTVYLAVALPKITINNQKIFAISPQSPLGIYLLEKQIGDTFTLNGTNYCIQDIQ